MPLGGEPIDVSHVDGLDHDGTADSSVGSAAANFSGASATVRTALNGHLVFFQLQITSTNALTATTGNIGDVTCFTLDAAYRPSEPVGFAWGSSVGGFGVLNTNGTVVLWVASDTVAAGSAIRLACTFLRP